MLRFNESIIHLDLGSTLGAHPNRFGTEFCHKLADVFETGKSLIQVLNLSNTSISGSDLQLIVDSIIRGQYKYLTSLDVSNNRISGSIGSSAIS